jgi:hypothetical protein
MGQTNVVECQNASPAETTRLIPAPPPPAHPLFVNLKPLTNASQKTPCHISPQAKDGLGHLPLPTRPHLPLPSRHHNKPTHAINTLLAQYIKPSIAIATGPSHNPLPASLITVGPEIGVNLLSWMPGVRNLQPLCFRLIPASINPTPLQPNDEFTTSCSSAKTQNLAAERS